MYTHVYIYIDVHAYQYDIFLEIAFINVIQLDPTQSRVHVAAFCDQAVRELQQGVGKAEAQPPGAAGSLTEFVCAVCRWIFPKNSSQPLG